MQLTDYHAEKAQRCKRGLFLWQFYINILFMNTTGNTKSTKNSLQFAKAKQPEPDDVSVHQDTDENDVLDR